MVNTLPYAFQVRYNGRDLLGSQWITWANDGLRELEKESLLPELTLQAGVEVDNDIWITPPADYRRPLELSHPLQPSIHFPVRETNGFIELTSKYTFDDDATPEAISAFSAQATDSVTINLDAKSDAELKNYLLVIDGGTLAGPPQRTYVLKDNDASTGGTTKVYFQKPLGSAWTAAQATSGYIISADYYLLLRYAGTYTPITALTDEIPVDDKFESALKAWLMWKAYERTQAVSKETQYWETQWEKKELVKLRGDRLKLGRSRKIRGRRLYGFEQNKRNRYATSHTSESS